MHLNTAKPHTFKVRRYVPRVKGWTFRVLFYFNETSHNHRSFLYLNIFLVRNMTSFGDKQHCLATTACKTCFGLYVNHLVVRGLFSFFLVLMYSAVWPLVCYVYISYNFSTIRVTNVWLIYCVCEIRTWISEW